MKALIYSTLNFPLFLLLGAFCISVQTSLFQMYPLSYLQPDALLVIVIWYANKRSLWEGGVMTLLLAHMAELHSSAPQGLFYVCYMLIFLATFGFRHLTIIPYLSSIVSITFFASILWKLTHILTLLMLGEGLEQWRHTFALLLPGSVMNAVLAVWLFRWFDRIDWVTFKNPKARSLMDGDLLLDELGF